MKKLSIDERVAAVKVNISLLDFAWRMIRYTGHGLSQSVRHWLTAGADFIDDIAWLTELVAFIRDPEKNLEKFTEKLAKPFIYYLISHLFTFGVLTIYSVGGIIAACARTAIQTFSRLFSLVRLLTARTEEDGPSEEQEQIYANMDSMKLVLRSGLLVLGGVGSLMLGLPALTIAGVGIGVMLAYAVIAHTWPNAIPYVMKWVRRHEPLILKKAVVHIKSAYHEIKNWFFDVKAPKEVETLFRGYQDNLLSYKSKVRVGDIKENEIKEARDWGVAESTRAMARIKKPRGHADISRDVAIHIKFLERQLNNMSAFTKIVNEERFQQRKRVLETIKEVLLKVQIDGVTNTQLLVNDLDKVYQANIKAFARFGFGVGPIEALFKETKALLGEDIHTRIEKYRKKNISNDRKYYTKQKLLAYPAFYLPDHAGLLSHVGLFCNKNDVEERLKYLNKTKCQKEASIDFLKEINKQVDHLIQGADQPNQKYEGVALTIAHLSNPAKLRHDLFEKLRHIDSDFIRSITGRGERAQIVDAIINKIDRFNLDRQAAREYRTIG